jgi:hypothetical protein
VITRRHAWCVLALPDGGGMGLCVPAGELPGHDVCSGCIPDAPPKLPPGAWYLPDQETLRFLRERGMISGDFDRLAELAGMGAAGRPPAPAPPPISPAPPDPSRTAT